MTLSKPAQAEPTDGAEPTETQPMLPRQHHTFLLRIWRNSPDEPWRATLRSANQTSRHFASLVELFTSLWQQVNQSDESEVV